MWVIQPRIPSCSLSVPASQPPAVSAEETTLTTPRAGATPVSVLPVRFLLMESESIPFGVILQLQHSASCSWLSKTQIDAQSSPAGHRRETKHALLNRDRPH